MNTLKVSKWFGFTLLCLVILSATLALVGSGAARDIQDKSSQLELIQEEGEQIDMILPDWEAVQAAPDTGKGQDGLYLTGGAKIIDPHRRIPTGGIAAMDPSNGVTRIPAGVRPTIDPSRGVGAFFNPADEMYEYVPAGHAVTLDPSGRIAATILGLADGKYKYVPAGGAKIIDPHRRTQAGGIAALDPWNGGNVWIQAGGTTGNNLDDEHDSSLISRIVKKPRRPKEK